jgi:hypothetical protein
MGSSNFKELLLQKKLIEKEFSCFKCTINGHGLSLTCKGILQPLENIEPYSIEIIQEPGCVPKIFVKSPKIKYDPKIHMYKSGNLCLYYPYDFNWNATTAFAHYLIPWVNEWIIYYELYKISGVWEGTAAPHRIVE